jgi:hypothetical protein
MPNSQVGCWLPASGKTGRQPQYQIINPQKAHNQEVSPQNPNPRPGWTRLRHPPAAPAHPGNLRVKRLEKRTNTPQKRRYRTLKSLATSTICCRYGRKPHPTPPVWHAPPHATRQTRPVGNKGGASDSVLATWQLPTQPIRAQRESHAEASAIARSSSAMPPSRTGPCPLA